MKILIIDDSKFIREVYKSELTDEGIEVEVASDGKEGLKKAKKVKPDVVLLDVIMPGANGFELIGEFKKDGQLKQTAIIIFSSLNQDSDIEKALSLGAVKYLPKKDFTPKQVAKELRQITSLL